MSWFGPRPCNCCEVDIPECACEDVGCFPSGRGQYSSVRLEIDIQDEMETATVTSAVDCDPDSPGYKHWRITTIARKLTGLSAFNGTYDLTYYVKDGASWVETSPSSDPCGYWFFPILAKPLYFSETRDVYYLSGGVPPEEETLQSTWRTRHLETDIIGWTDWLTESDYPRLSWSLSTVPNYQGTVTGLHYDCQNPEAAPTVANWTDSLMGSGVYVRPAMRGMQLGFGNTIAYREEAVVNGVNGFMRGRFKHDTFAASCLLHHEEVTAASNAYNHVYTQGQSCDGTPYQLSTELQIQPYTANYKLVLNA